MTDAHPVADEPTTRSAPEVVAPTNHVTVALPFSKITVPDSNKELAELADVVAELVSAVEGLAPGPGLKRLRRRAQALAARTR